MLIVPVDEGMLSNDRDEEGDKLNARVVALPAQGSLRVRPRGFLQVRA